MWYAFISTVCSTALVVHEALTEEAETETVLLLMYLLAGREVLQCPSSSVGIGEIDDSVTHPHFRGVWSCLCSEPLATDGIFNECRMWQTEKIAQATTVSEHCETSVRTRLIKMC